MNTTDFGMRPGPLLARMALLAFCIVLLAGFIPQARAQATGMSASRSRRWPALPICIIAIFRRASTCCVRCTPNVAFFRSGSNSERLRSRRRLAQALRDAGAHGLDPADYDADWIDAQIRSSSPRLMLGKRAGRHWTCVCPARC